MSKLFSLLLSSTLFMFSCGSASDAEQVAVVADAPSVAQVKEIGSEVPSFSVWNTAPNPESVTINGAFVYVTHFGDELAPMKKDGDGYVAVYDANGTLFDTLVTGLHAPKGSVVRAKTYFVVDIDQLLGFNTTSGEQVLKVNFSGKSKFLNGLAKGPGDILYVSGTDVGKIWSVSTATGEVNEIAQVAGANGLAYDAKRNALYAVGYVSGDPKAGRVYKIDPSSKDVNVVGDYAGVLDGAFLQSGFLYFTDWSAGAVGKLVALDLVSFNTSVVAEDSLFAGPANFDMMGDGLAMIPMLTGAKVVAVRTR